MSASRRRTLPPTDASVALANSAVSGLDEEGTAKAPSDTTAPASERDAKARTNASGDTEAISGTKTRQRRSQGRQTTPVADPVVEEEPEQGDEPQDVPEEAPPAQAALSPARPAQAGMLAWLSEPEEGMSASELGDWITLLNAKAGKLGSTLRQARVDYAAWEKTVGRARAAGVHEDVIEAAAKRVSIPIPASPDQQD